MLYALCYFIGNPEEIMSGIAGIYYLDGRPVERTDVQRMVDSIAHRGPDGSGVWTDGSVGFGHRMLWTTPESLHEKLPFTNKTGDLTITADARIDNRDELIPALNFNGRPREAIPDSEIILAAYEKWGEKCPEKLLGDFSFAIWDKRNRTVFCARDPIGIKPFYYYFKEGKFRWSSEPKAIFEDNAIPKEPNLPLICLYLLSRFDEREETLYKDVYRLPPSHFMVLENGCIRKGQYWDIDPNYSIRYKTDEEYAEHFLSLFKDAVKVRLRSHGPVGAFLSGGLDSSSIVCTAQMLFKEKSIKNNGFETFSLIFDRFPCDERFYINEVAQKWDLKINYFIYEKNLSCANFEQTKKYPGVGYFPLVLSLIPIQMDALQKGIRIMISGVGGDELFSSGANHLTDLTLSGNIIKLMTQLRHDSVVYSCSPYSLFLNYCIKPFIPRPIKVCIKEVIKPFYGNEIPSWINSNFFKKAEIAERINPVRSIKQFQTRSQQEIYAGIRYGWNNNITLSLNENLNSHFGKEIRYPFFDRRLFEFSLAIPEEQRWRDDCPKTVLRQAMEGVLPNLVKNRKNKAEYSSVVDWEVKKQQAHKMEEFILTSALANIGLINNEQFYRMFKHYQNGKPSCKIINLLQAFIWLELWYRSEWTDVRKEERND
jgi:asparagine synthase (glutamine-hydrolysing)